MEPTVHRLRVPLSGEEPGGAVDGLAAAAARVHPADAAAGEAHGAHQGGHADEGEASREDSGNTA